MNSATAIVPENSEAINRWKVEEKPITLDSIHLITLNHAIISTMSTAVVLPAAFPLVGLGLASTYFLTVCPLSLQYRGATADVLVVPGK